MGANYYSYAVIGVKIDPKKLVTATEIRGCECEEVPTGKFCQNCGKKAFVQEDEKDLIWDYEEDDDFPCDYKLIFGTDREEVIIAAFWSEQNEYNDKDDFSQIPDNIGEIKEKMKNILEPLGFWSEKDFGLWSVLYCSY